ncbi:MAG TPA: hypothetical protein VGN72_11525 [Tepidisphaeraceae bacterium]|jgi:serine/threonine-protein kinase ATR|nr:hypothetical protein [Tepidisphaeraceae bacterium]
MTLSKHLHLLSAAVLLSTTASSAQVNPKPLLRDFIGINAHTVQFDPELYAPLCKLVRDYHPFDWDVRDGNSADLRGFPVAQHIDWKDTSGKFRSWHAPVNWHELYASWQKQGFEIDACIQFDGFTPDKWKDMPADAYRYGKAFAEYFGPSGANKLVTSVEIGNEPAGQKRFSPEQYKVIFENMARGVRDGDPKLQILTCTVEAGEPDGWSMPLDLFKDSSNLYDVINLHKYALMEGWPSFERTYPENATVNYRGQLQKSIDWRDANAPGKEVWVTEFGYDASTKEPAADNSKWKDSTDLQQAQWIVRSFLMFSEMNLDRAYLYWFNDSDAPSFHAASGVTRNMEPKPSYHAMRHLYQSLGDYRFAKAVEKVDDDVYVFEYAHGQDPD